MPSNAPPPVLHDCAGWSPYQQQTSAARVIESPMPAMLLGSGGAATAFGATATATIPALKTNKRRTSMFDLRLFERSGRGSTRSRGRQGLVDVAVARADALASVVAAEVRPIVLAQVRVLVELRRVLDLVLRPVDVHLLVGGVDPVDHTGREHDLLAEDPRAGVDNDVARADVVGRLVDLPDASVGRLDAE